jgi:glucose/mannose transport system permease protein
LAQLAETVDSAGVLPRQTLERIFIWSLSAALIWRLAANFGFLDFVSGWGGAGEAVFNYLPWVGLVVALGMIGLIVSGSRADGNLRTHRVFKHVIAWSIITLLVLLMWAFGDEIAVGIGWIVGQISAGWQSLMASMGFGPPASQSPTKLWGILIKFFHNSGLFLAAATALIAVALAAIGSLDAAAARPGNIERIFVGNIVAKIAAVPMALTAVGVFVGATLWTVFYSFTNSRMLPSEKFVGFDQYKRLWSSQNNRWWQSIENLGIYAVVIMVCVLTIGFLLAVLLDQKIRFENTFRTIILYPFALSFIVTGLIWQWLLTPQYGVQAIVRGFGWESFTFDPLYTDSIVIFGICIAGLWHGTGLVMCLMLAGLRGIDEEIWKAARIDGIPTWKTYLRIVIPMMRPVFITTIVLIASGILRVYDLVVAQTSGGPGIASEVPAKYVYDYMFGAQNLGQGFAASTMMLLAVCVIVIPWAILEFGNRKHG